MQPVVITQSRKRWLVFLVGAMALVVAGVLLLVTGGATIVPWITIVFFGGCALIFLKQLVDNRPRITISDRGIEDRLLRVGLIDWADIQSVRLWRRQGNAFLGMELRDSGKYVERLSPLMQRMAALNEKLGVPTLSLNLAGTDAVPEQVESLLIRELEVRSRARAT